MIDVHLQNIWALKPDKLWRELLLYPRTIVSLLCPLIKVNPLMEEKEK